MNEATYQAGLIKRIRELLPGCLILKNDSSYMPGIPDLLILYKNEWAMLEVKMFNDSRRRPNQDYYIDLLGAMSFASFINPGNEEAVLDDLQYAFRSFRETRIPQS